MRKQIILILFPFLILAQEKDAIFVSDGQVIERTYPSSRGILDTLGYPGGYGGQFIMSPGDAMLMTFQMPADGILKGVNIPIYEWGTGDQQMTVSLHKLTYPNGADGGPYEQDAVDGNGWIGGYDHDTTSGESSISGTTYEGSLEEMADNAADPLGPETGSGPPGVPPQGLIWPDGFNIYPTNMDPSTHGDFTNDGEVDHWFNLADFGSEPELLQGDWVGVLVAFSGAGGGDDEPTGFFYKDGAEVVEPWRFLKFYAAGENYSPSGNGGWHIRHWLILNELAVELTGDRGPKFVACLEPLSEPPICAWVTDDNPSGGPAGVDSVVYHYSVDYDTNWVSLPMALVQGDSLEGQWKVNRPDVSFGPTNSFISAVDVMGNRTELPQKFYSIFTPREPNLFIYNADDFNPSIMDYYLYNSGLEADFWDPTDFISRPLLQNYDLIIEITGSGPSVINNPYITHYLDSGRGDYILTGDEWLGAQTGWQDTCYPAGTFQHDYLGIDCDHNDINYTASGDQGGTSLLFPVENDPISGRMYEFLGDTNRLIYDPPFSNWLDGVDPLPGTEVAYYGVSGILNDSGEPAGSDTFATGIYRTHNSGSRVVFLAFDPLGVNHSPLNWVGTQSFTVLSEAIKWVLEDNVSISTGSVLPTQFALHQNYPNPFNPVTTIRYELPKFSNVNLTVYNILGREVAQLIDPHQNPGIKQVQWNASSVPSGVYFIQMQAGDFRQVRKVMVLK